jgi:glycosyltransferase involved in cell wall biosynthesis
MLTCLVIPHYEHVDQFSSYLPLLVRKGFPLIVVDDASTPSSVGRLERLLDEHAPGTLLVKHDQNLGKGGAVISGLEAARAAGYSHAIQVDADGQHDPKALESIHGQSCIYPDRIICGQPVFDENISRVRYYFRFLTTYLAWAETLSTEIKDALCGLRAYPLDAVLKLVRGGGRRLRMDFDPEILVRAVWAGIPLHYVPVHVSYPVDGTSHFQYIRDNFYISWMHTRLLFGMLPRSPVLLARKVKRMLGRPRT